MNQSIVKQQIARAFAYCSATLLIGVVIHFLTQGIIPFIRLPEIAGAVFILGFLLIYFNIGFALSRRFCSQTYEFEHFPYLLAFLLILPTLLLVHFTERFADLYDQLLFYAIIMLASLSGVFFGIRSGRKKRDRLIEEVIESTG